MTGTSPLSMEDALQISGRLWPSWDLIPQDRRGDPGDQPADAAKWFADVSDDDGQCTAAILCEDMDDEGRWFWCRCPNPRRQTDRCNTHADGDDA